MLLRTTSERLENGQTQHHLLTVHTSDPRGRIKTNETCRRNGQWMVITAIEYIGSGADLISCMYHCTSKQNKQAHRHTGTSEVLTDKGQKKKSRTNHSEMCYKAAYMISKRKEKEKKVPTTHCSTIVSSPSRQSCILIKGGLGEVREYLLTSFLYSSSIHTVPLYIICVGDRFDCMVPGTWYLVLGIHP